MTLNEIIDRTIVRWTCPTVRIEWRGVPLQLRSGKSAWANETEAKKAMYSHLKASGLMFDIKRALGQPATYHDDELKAFLDQQINDGEIKFVRLDNE
jgi:hypothetical protein